MTTAGKKPTYVSLAVVKVLKSFAPIASSDARILILGSMPGVASLEATRSYAFPRNACWKIMGDLYDAGPELEYQQRLTILMKNQIALWDVIATCRRPGSLDSAISVSGMKTNDFAGFFSQYTKIRRIYFNGQKAADLFNRKVAPNLSGHYQYLTLPSTSPANAAKSYADKLDAWSVIKSHRTTT